jgi:hypothetical protein
VTPAPEPTGDPVVDPLALVALCISIFAALVGLSALIWNIIAWVRSGHRVVVQIEAVVRNPGRSASWVGRRGRRGWAATSVPPSHVLYSVVFVKITARNVGRAAVDIERFYFSVGKPAQNKNMSWTYDDDPPLPQRLEPGASASREYMLTNVEAFARREGSRRFRGAVELGDGTSRRSPLGFDLDARDRGAAFLATSTGQTLQTPAPRDE